MLKKYLFFFIFFSFSLLKGFGQVEKTTTQVGIGALPIYDVFRLYPDNTLEGFGVSVNLGYFPIKRMSVGINPFYVQAANSYTYHYRYNEIHTQREDMKIYGLNAYVRYYVITKNKIFIYPSLALGFGAAESTVRDIDANIFKERKSAPAFILALGLGFNYFITEKITLELHVPYVNIKYLTVDLIDPQFHTVAPTLGVQFHMN